MTRFPPVALARWLHQLLHDSWRHVTFPRNCGAFRGVHRTFEEAVARVPGNKLIGYNHHALANDYVATLKDTIEVYDYPMLFWFSTLLKENVTIFDFGGNVGTHFYAYS